MYYPLARGNRSEFLVGWDIGLGREQVKRSTMRLKLPNEFIDWCKCVQAEADYI